MATILYFFFGWYVSIFLLLLAIIPCEFPKLKSFSIAPYSDAFSPELKSQLFPCTESELVFCFVRLYYCCFVFKFCSLLCSPSQLCRWLKEVFLSADKSGDGLLSVDEVFCLMHKLNVKISNRKLRETFKVCVCVCVYFSLSFFQMTWYFSESIVCIFGCGLPRIFWMLDFWSLPVFPQLWSC